MKLERSKVLARMEAMGIGRLSDLADTIGVYPQTLSYWFAGVQSPTWDNLGRLCNALSCTVDDLVVYDRPKALAPVPA